MGSGGTLSADDVAISWELESGSDVVERGRNLLDTDRESSDREPVRQILQSTKVHLGIGTVVRQVQRVWYFPTAESVQEFGSDVISFDGRTDGVVVREAATILPGGEVVRFDPETVQVVDSDTYDEFSDTREAVILYPRLEPGSLAVLHFEVSTDRDAMEAPWSFGTFPQQLFPRDRFEVTVSWDLGFDVKWSSDSTHLTCERGHSAVECVGRDVPAAAYDPRVSWRDELGQTTFSEYRDWNHVIEVAAGAFDKALGRSDGASRILDNLIEEGMSREAVIARLHQFVAREIRYVSVSERGHAITPHEIDETLEKGYGDCKDKSALLTVLLNRAGIDAFPVLVATKRMDPDRLNVASMLYFDHMLVCLDEGSDRRCVDTVDSYADSSSTAHWVQGRVALDLVQGSRPGLVPHDRYRWQLGVETAIAFDEDGSQTETSVRSYLDAYAGVMRGFLANRSSDQIERWARDEYEGNYGDMAQPEFEFSGLDELSEPFSVRTMAAYPPLIEADGDFNYVERSAWLTDELESVMLENQHYRSFFPGLRVESEYLFTLPPKWRLEWAGPWLDFEFAYGTMKREVRLEGQDLRFETLLEMPARWVSKEETDRFNEFVRVLGDEGVMSFHALLASDP